MNQFPGFMPMQPMQKQPSIGQMGMQMMQAALARQRNNAPGTPATPEVPQGGTLPGGAMNLVPAAQANPGGMGLLSGIIDKLKGAPQQNIDPNTGMPVTADVMAGAADLGGAGPAPNALTGSW